MFRASSCYFVVRSSSLFFFCPVLRLLKPNIEDDRRVRHIVFRHLRDGTNQLTMPDEAVSGVVLVGIAFKLRVGFKVELRNELLVSGGSNHVMDVLRAVVVLSGDDRLEPVLAAFVDGNLAAMMEALKIVIPLMIRMKDFDGGGGKRLPVGVTHAPGDEERCAGFILLNQSLCSRRTLPVKRAERVARRQRMNFGALSIYRLRDDPRERITRGQ